jgi:hypothetical protein
MVFPIPRHDGLVRRVDVIQTPKLPIHLAAVYVGRPEEVNHNLVLDHFPYIAREMNCNDSAIRKNYTACFAIRRFCRYRYHLNEHAVVQTFSMCTGNHMNASKHFFYS